MDDSVLDAAFSALGDKTRRAILVQLMKGSSTVTALAEPFDMSLNAVSKHIKMLEKGGLIERSIKGRVHTISIADNHLHQLQDWLKQFSGAETSPAASHVTKPLTSQPSPQAPRQPEAAPKTKTSSTTPRDSGSHSGGLLDKLASRLTKLGR